MKHKQLLLLFFLKVSFGFSQSANSSINQISDAFLERIEVKTGNIANSYHTNLKPYSRQQIGEYISQIDTSTYLKFSKIDKQNLEYIHIDNWEYIDSNRIISNLSQKPILKYLYQNKSDMYFAKNKDFDIHASPILNVSIGKNGAYGSLPSKSSFINTRGVEIRGQINKKLGFYTMVTDNQNSSPNFLVNYYDTYEGYPYQSFVKYKDDDLSLLQADYFQAIGYFTFKPIKNLTLAFGHDKNFVGYGIRSMILSDFSAPYMQLKADLHLGRMQYMSILAQMTDLQIINPPFSQITNAPKYFAFHHLNFNITKTLNIGLYESVMYGNRKTGFELNYLNPVIFYRFIEGYLGSSDNAMVGADFKLNVLKTASLYGQYYLDEYNSKEFKKNGWWSKKYAWQLGMKYFDALKIKNLDLQVEFNRARPYMYSHFTTSTNMVNYNLPIAHPLGANFKEYLVSVKYQPHAKVFLNYTFMNAIKGEDIDSTNYGGNTKLNNKFDRPSDYDNYIGQGFKNHIKNSEFSASFMVKHNLFIEFIYQHRKDSYQTNASENIYSTGIRWNITRKQLLF
ncbi:capsule assembly Wzi family protein [Lacihabitans sp. LS3-19]|uniref:capsule assembly Wzi family protein n=1 Tax=Lacihabitans sp. LS3-19 TaxID=2487335 RepID=UPI0020CEE97D|nr:capsule assembly Wzi family protein [Lacihabitans sp. LS3-19]